MLVLATAVAPARVFLVPVIAVASAALAVSGLLAWRPPAARAWWTVATGVCVLASGYLISAVDAGRWPGLERPYPQVYDAIFVTGSVIVLVGIVMLLGRLHPPPDNGDLIDALVVAVGIGSLVLQRMFGAAWVSGEAIPAPPLAALLFPLASLVLMTAVVRVLLTGGFRNPTLLLLVASVVAAVLSDIPRARQAASGTVSYDSIWAVASVVKLVLFAAAVLSPGVADARLYAPARPALGSRSRLLVVAGLALIGPVILTVAWLLGRPVNPRLPIVATVIIIVLSLIRADGLLRRIEHRATHDSLTDVLDRATFHQAAASAVARSAQGWYIGILDIDNFKTLNDTYGHLVGDEVLIVAARRLVGVLGPEDVVGRFGGDEFAVLFRSRTVQDTARQVVDRLREPMAVAEQVLDVGVSLGVSQLRGAGSADDAVVDALRRADRAMYSVKGTGRGFAVAQ